MARYSNSANLFLAVCEHFKPFQSCRCSFQFFGLPTCSHRQASMLPRNGARRFIWRQQKKRYRSIAAAIFVPFSFLISVVILISDRSDHKSVVAASISAVDELNFSVRSPGYDASFCKSIAQTETPTNFLRSSNRAWLALLLPIVAFLFGGLAVVTDEYFVASLERICDCLSLSDDVAGATFMAAGSSAPELFTSLLSTLKNGDDLGVGTIVGSAVFNICVIVGVSAFFAGAPLALDPRPLARDAFFYALSVSIMLLVLLLPGTRGTATWWEGALMIAVYAGYIAFMAFGNKPYLKWSAPLADSVRGATSEVASANTASKMENDGCCLLQACLSNPETCVHTTSSSGDQVSTLTSLELAGDLVEVQLNDDTASKNGMEGQEDGNDKLFLGISVPTTMTEWAIAPLLLPWKFVFYWTIPDCNKPHLKKWWPITFTMSVFWIMGVSYLMVEATRLSGCFIGIPSAVMGLTFLAAGTSVPDALASVAVARAGRADMAVSNAIGSNVFDVLLGLGLPWLIAGAASGPVEVTVDPIGLVVIPIVILFVTLGLLIGALIVCKWKLSRTLGVILFGLYALFLAYALLDVFVFKIGGH